MLVKFQLQRLKIFQLNKNLEYSVNYGRAISKQKYIIFLNQTLYVEKAKPDKQIGHAFENGIPMVLWIG